ncbi:MAG: putative dehydrogenase [Candidatus Saganbacteria bacterium]|uniref:Putative dehydrogenase n=1 Tax=Candidatus Saganbacteria bacterium TaxID=2575572 RepID=A0A833L546_UNCSA|nr:MAG: putative dehydrogenase [Candidatus Saganbacteria bacterium]
MEKVDITIIGAGVIGLAIAESLSRKYANRDIIVLEKNEKYGQETSSRNSEVIHAGIYYPKDSLKSKLCLSGNKMLYELCEAKGIKYKKCGKLIVSTNKGEISQIEAIYQNARNNGVPILELLGKDAISKLEPDVFALNAVFSGSTGIIDSHGLMNYLYQTAKQQSVLFSFNNEVVGIEKEAERYILRSKSGEEIHSGIVINCAGLDSDKVAGMAGFDIEALKYKLYYCKGDYFSITQSQNKLKHLIYPPPHEKGYGLGVHTTLALDGNIRLGPDANYVDTIDYEVDENKGNEFFNSAKKYLPWLKEDMLAPDTSGMRPKLQEPNDGFRDFIIKEESNNGLSNFINLIGIESPGLTSCLAVGDYVCGLVNYMIK